MNILYHHRTMGRGGEARHITDVIRAFRNLGHTVKIMSPPGADPFENINYKPVDKSDTTEFGIKKIWKAVSTQFPQPLFEIFELCYNYFALFKFNKYYSKKLDLVYERYAFFLWAGAFYCHIRKIPFLLEVNEVSGLRRAREQKFILLANQIEKWVFRKADVIFCVSSKLKGEILERGVPEAKVSITPNAVNLEDFQSLRNDIDLRDTYKLHDKIVLGFVGWFDYWDNLEELIVVFKEVYKKEKKARLLLVGDGPVINRIERKISDLELDRAVILTGPVDKEKVKYYINVMDICLIPHSNNFGSPIVLFEFMALKKPVIAPDLPPIKDVITDKHNGLIFTPKDKKSLIKHILRLINDGTERKRLGENAFASVSGKHTWQNNVKNMIAVYQKLQKQ